MQTQGQVVRRTLLPKRIFYGWYIMAAGMGMHLWLSIAWVYGIQVFFTPIVKNFGWSRAVVSGAFSFQRLEGSILTPIEGFLVDRYGPRFFAIGGAFIAGLGLMSLSLVNSLWMFYVSVLITSGGLGLCIGVPRTWSLVQWFRRLRGRALGIGASGAVISGPLLFIVVWLVENLGWRQAFLVLGVATWVICIPLAFVFRGRPQQYGQLPDGDAPQEAGQTPLQTVARRGGGGGGASEEGGFTPRQALKTPSFWILALVFGLQGMGTSALIIHMIPYFVSIGFTTAQGASVLAMFTLLSAFGRLGGGWIMDYVDKRLVYVGILVCQVISFLILANVSTFWQTVPFALFYGLAFGGIIPANAIIVSSYFGTRSFGAIQGLVQSATVVTGMIAPVMTGWIFDQTGSYTLAIYILMAAAALAIPLTFFARPPRRLVEAAATP